LCSELWPISRFRRQRITQNMGAVTLCQVRAQTCKPGSRRLAESTVSTQV
jgi:hypothetical protein